MADDLYARLGVKRDATVDDIKRAFRREALTTHPDRPGGSKEAFQKLSEAYETLTNPQKRAEYDATGAVPRDDASGGMSDISEILGSLFSGGMGFGIPFSMFGTGVNGPVKSARGPNKIHEIGVSLSDFYYGKSFTLNMTREILCDGCDGVGGAKTDICTACGGRGMRVTAQQMGPITAMTNEPCNTCAQTGKRIVESCRRCNGKRVVESKSVLNVNITPGMEEGNRLVFPGQCSESPQFEAPGDVILVLRAATTDDSTWVRRGTELLMEVQLQLSEALLGWERTIPSHPSGKPLHLVWGAGALRDGEILRVPKWGMPVGGTTEYGDLRIVCRIIGEQGAWSEEQLRALQSVWPEWKKPVVTETTVMPTRPAHP